MLLESLMSCLPKHGLSPDVIQTLSQLHKAVHLLANYVKNQNCEINAIKALTVFILQTAI